jgi:hypothetical protein
LSLRLNVLGDITDGSNVLEISLGESLFYSSYSSQGQLAGCQGKLSGTDSKWMKTLTHQTIPVT